ncbi:MAG: SDR family oxidoreductase [Acidimicrobiia bacterium]|nr:SDR family oxidoreductase [Acidimicrobiia bacterium]
MTRFAGKVAVVTGSTQGLGEAIVHRFADDGVAGVVVTGRNAERGEKVRAALEYKGVDAMFVGADLADPASPQTIVRSADEMFGRIDVLVNAAALTARGSIIDTSVDLWDSIMNVNVRAPFFLVQEAAKVMRREGIAGSVVNIGSVSAYGSLSVLAPYAISKGALVAMTKNAAYALSRDRIRVNTFNLGWMDTPAEHVIQTTVHGQPENWLELAEAEMPFGRLLKTAEVAEAVAFAASDDSGMMTGAVIDFDQSVIGGGAQPILPPADRP